MGDAKRRREREAAEALTLSPERRLLRRAANVLHDGFIAPNRLAGACHYTAFGLHHYLATQHGLTVPVHVGFVRYDDVAWATHSWLELEGRKTDLAIHYPNAPALPGPMLIDGEVVARGQTVCFYALIPDDGAPTAIAMSTGSVAGERRAREHQYFTDLARQSDLAAIEQYLAGDPSSLYDKLQAVWVGFIPDKA